MESNSIIFENPDFGRLSIYGTPDAPLFVTKDVCAILGISKYRDALDRLEDFEKGCPVIVDTPGGRQSVSTVTESGLYTLILRSNKPAAVPFRKWVVTEVLPAIRRTGVYAQQGQSGGGNLTQVLQAGLSVLTTILTQNQELMRVFVGKQLAALEKKAGTGDPNAEVLYSRKEETLRRNKRLAQEYGELREKGMNSTKALCTLSIRWGYSADSIRMFIQRAGFKLSDFGRVPSAEAAEAELQE